MLVFLLLQSSKRGDVCFSFKIIPGRNTTSPLREGTNPSTALGVGVSMQ